MVSLLKSAFSKENRFDYRFPGTLRKKRVRFIARIFFKRNN